MRGLSSGILELMGPLSGIRIVEVGVWHAGPGAGAILGDMGADVIKVETPAGSGARAVGPFVKDIPGPNRSLIRFCRLSRTLR